MRNSKAKHVILGPLKNKKNPSKTGGIIILFDDFVRWLSSQKIEFSVIDTNKANYKLKFLSLVHIFWSIVVRIPKASSVSLHGTMNDYIYISPFLVWYARIWNTKVCLRKFAGNFEELYNNELSAIKKASVKYALRNANVLLFETKNLLKFGQQFNRNSYWLPNTRLTSEPKTNLPDTEYTRNFVFISHVSREKGLEDLIKVFSELGAEYSLTIYGPIVDPDIQLGISPNIRYNGVLNPNQVPKVLSTFDCLILPSYREGYPGIIIEAFSVGIPIITTRVGGIPEIVQHNVQGILVEPGNLSVLKKEIASLTSDKIRNFRVASADSFRHFDSAIVYPTVIKHIVPTS